MRERISAAEANLDRLVEWIGRYDAKSSALVGIDTAMVGALALVVRVFGLISFKSLSGFVALSLLACVFLLLFVGSYPQLKEAADSLLFFGTIARKEVTEFKKSFKTQTDQEYLEDLLGQCHRNSQILDKKFRYLKLAFQTFLIAMIPWSLALLL